MSPSEQSSVVLVKLGGSVLTDKRRPGTVRENVLERLALELAAARSRSGLRLVVGHGSGSFGHVVAARHDLSSGVRSEEQLRGVAETQSAARQLHDRVIAALLAADASPYSLSPSSFLTASGGQPLTYTVKPLLMALEIGLLPVVYGDVVLDRERGASICSTETVLRLVARRLVHHGHRIERAVWVGETDGVYDEQGRSVRHLDESTLGRIGGAAGAASGVDVTGGMRHRLDTVRALARRGIESWLVNGLEEGRLAAAVEGREREAGGTRFAPVGSSRRRR